MIPHRFVTAVLLCLLWRKKRGQLNELSPRDRWNWLPLTVDFTDKNKFAGEQNIAHIINVALQYPIPARSAIYAEPV